MCADSVLGLAAAASGLYALAVLTAILPWVNAEVVMISAAAVCTSGEAISVAVILVTAGQMTGKSAMYWMMRYGDAGIPVRLRTAIERWRAQLAERPRRTLATILTSAVIGIPPFYVVSAAAGAFRVDFCRFVIVGTCGRLVHFAVVAFAPHFFWRSL
jgi:membrane protein YqaA with SNARE-associated domain